MDAIMECIGLFIGTKRIANPTTTILTRKISDSDTSHSDSFIYSSYTNTLITYDTISTPSVSPVPSYSTSLQPFDATEDEQYESESESEESSLSSSSFQPTIPTTAYNNTIDNDTDYSQTDSDSDSDNEGTFSVSHSASIVQEYNGTNWQIEKQILQKICNDNSYLQKHLLGEEYSEQQSEQEYESTEDTLIGVIQPELSTSMIEYDNYSNNIMENEFKIFHSKSMEFILFPSITDETYDPSCNDVM